MFTLSRAEAREFDRRALAEFGVPGIVLMENAGRGCAELLMRLNPQRQSTVVLCGPGNNGGDGFVIARHLDNAGWPVTVWLFAIPEQLTGDAGINYHIARSARLIGETASTLHGWVIDALFGTGLNRGLSDPFDKWVAAINASGCPILAVDVPTGLDCDTGEPFVSAVRATHTATFVAPKRGFLNSHSKDWTGEVHVIDIGAPRVLVEQYQYRVPQTPS